ncbi:ABC transporter ATP-binding protein [Roseospira visakhapatnamensis]|uniref:Multiple sugar transport system ATP-binding protein n=1 Tax=Roseospira visakhapatnamensis TaxID=390880 RepID=A0A7W6R9Z8_9PROT|nr:ABC transporter ATP-binding protein [Roseospira visakhapatnamensis]MBB4264685.1 multiple sugar transport system ATP-binding protein [Roseospira visakhapatnamensis]
MPRIRFDSVEKRYGQTQVLPPFDLTFEDGEFTVLVGPSGCGKSTTLRMLAGLEEVTSGEIWFDDRPITRLEPKDRDIAMVFQDYALYPHMNIAKNMSFALRLQRVPKAEIDAKVDRVARMLGIETLLQRKPGELSGGQRQRVAMGRALVRDASTFLFDEPLSNLDAKLRGKMRTELAEMRNTLDKNMVYVTHDQVEAMTLGDRIVVMANGLVQQQGSAEELFKAPANAFVAGFIGSPTMNFLNADLVEDNGTLAVRGPGFTLDLPPDFGARTRALSGPEVIVGIRPAGFQLASDRDARGSTIDLSIKVSEYLGNQTILVTMCGDHDIVVELDSAARFQRGTTTTFVVAPDHIMVFDKKTELRL